MSQIAAQSASASFELPADLATVTDIMRNLSLQTDPQEASLAYGRGMRKMGMMPADVYLSVSRRGLQKPAYRITRSSTWKVPINPWKEPDRLPLLLRGLLGDLIYANQPAIIDDLPDRFAPDDPAAEYFDGMKVLVTLPHYDNGESINMGVFLARQSDGFAFDRLPMQLWMANLWGRATLNLVNRQKLEAAYAAMDRELRVVADIQRSLLPRALPKIEGVDLAAHYQTSQRAGGDYYDFFRLPEGRWGLLVADVSGHGTPAAVIMAITHAIAHTRPGHPTPPRDLLADLNRILTHRYTTDNGTFVTAFYGVLDPANRRLAYASAGHPPPRLVRAGQVYGVDGATSLPLGVQAAETFAEAEMQLQPRDALLLYTDGIPEAFSPDGQLFGLPRLDAACCAANGTPQSLIDQVLHGIADFASGTPASDDRTLVALTLH